MAKKEEFSRTWLYGLVLYWLAGITLLFWAGAQTDTYKLHVMHIPLPHPYPWKGVGTFAGIATIEVFVLLWTIRPWNYHSEWTRLLLAMVLQCSMLLFFALSLMHAPPYISYHWMWLVAGLILLMVGLFATLVWIAYEIFWT